MREQDAFESQLTREIDYQAGPRGSVDAMAITRTAQAPKWRIRTMLNATNFIAAGSVAAAVIALAVIGQPLFQDQQEPVPAAPETISVPQAFSGTIGMATDADAGTYVYGSPLRTTRDRILWLPADFTDPRLNGVMTLTSNYDEYWSPGQLLSVDAHTRRIVNGEGAWEGSAVSLGVPFGDSYRTSTFTEVLHGEGAYEGLIAIMESDHADLTHETSVEGIILEADLPPFPEAAPAE